MPRDTDTDRLERGTRRSFLQKLGALGFSAGAARFMTAEAVADRSGDLGETVPYIAAMSRIKPDGHTGEPSGKTTYPIYERKPYDEWIEMKAAEQVAETIQQETSTKTDIETAAGIARTTSAQRSKLVIEVEYPIVIDRQGNRQESLETSFDHFKGAVPDSAEGQVDGRSREFDVVPKKSVVRKQNSFDWDYGSDLPAGCYAQYEWDCRGYYYDMTIGTPAWDSKLPGDSFVTAGHNIMDCGVVHQSYAPDEIGESGDRVADETYFDAAVIDVNSSHGSDWQIAGKYGTTDWYIGGKLFWEQLQDKVQTGGSLKVQGEETGRSTGVVTNTKKGNDSWDKVVDVDVNTDDGDSGGPYFDVRTVNGTDYAYISAIHMGQSPSGGARGTVWMAIEDRWPSLNI